MYEAHLEQQHADCFQTEEGLCARRLFQEDERDGRRHRESCCSLPGMERQEREAARAERVKERERKRKELQDEEDKKKEEERKERMKAGGGTGGDRGEGERGDRDRDRGRDREGDKRREAGYRRPGGSSAGEIGRAHV